MFDINTAIGHWPFRRIPNQTAAELSALLTGFGIRGAAVANTHGLFYKNCHDANLELFEELAPHADMFVGVATLNPRYAAWERDLRICAESLRCRALRLAPQYHDYTLGDGCCRAIVKAASSLHLPVFVPHRVVDVRQRHWLDTETVIPLADVVALARAVPDAQIVFTEFAASSAAVSTAAGQPLCPNLYLEMSRIPSCYGQVLAAVVKTVGAGNVLFGSGAPFKEVSPALLKLQHADLAETERRQVAGDSARTLLGL